MAGNRNGFYFRGEINPFGMKRIILSLSLLVAASAPAWSDGNGLTQKEIDNGGTGLFKAVAVSEPTLTQKNAEGRVSELWLERDGRRIYGLQSVPDCPVKKVAIVSHGFNGSCEFARDYFQTLNRLGYLVYAMEFPGGSVRSRSDSNTMNMSVLDEKEDVKAAVRYFCRQPDVDREHIVLIGESQGGLVSALAAADLPQEISGLVLVYPALCIPDDWNGRYPRVADIPDTTWLWGVPLSKRFFLELRPMDVYREITKYQGPVQIINGSRDAVVPLRYSEEAMKRYRDAHLGVIPGAGHGFGPAERRVANRFVEEFLTR